MFDTYIFISNEDSTYNVLGGIGTYIGVFSKSLKKAYPKMEVIWISKSITGKDFEEIDEFGVHKIYLTSKVSDDKLQFNNLFDDNYLGLDRHILHHRMSEKCFSILSNKTKSKICLEIGEWEGYGSTLFSMINNPNVAKVARIHTPLATCMKQNKLTPSLENNIQLIDEYNTVINANILSACTLHVKNKLIKDVVGEKYNKKIIVIPNPINSSEFSPELGDSTIGRKIINKAVGSKILSKDVISVLILGSVESRKGVELVIDSIPLSVDSNPLLRFVFVGYCGDDKEINHNANTKLSPKSLLKRIQKKYWEYVGFTNYIDHDQLPNIIQAGDLFPIMSLGDNFPGTVAEISLMKKPLLTLLRGGVLEMVSAKNGSIVTYGLGSSVKDASKKLSKGIIKLSYNKPLRDEIAQRSYKHFINTYSDKILIPKTLETYQSLKKHH